MARVWVTRGRRARGQRAGTRAESGPTERGAGGRFVVHEHKATRLHYDFRLELGGVLKSWALPKGPSMNPADKRLAVAVPDHPVEYGDYEGIIPEGTYGAGPVVVWDSGTWEPAEPGDPEKQLEDGTLAVWLDGRKLSGGWVLTRLARGSGRDWLLIKRKDRPGGTS
jgi:bifunctional non-homologous end joining protein LigD